MTRPSFADMREYFAGGLGERGGQSHSQRRVLLHDYPDREHDRCDGDRGGYYVAIQIIWSFMLVPVLAFADSAKALVANSFGNLERVKTPGTRP